MDGNSCPEMMVASQPLSSSLRGTGMVVYELVSLRNAAVQMLQKIKHYLLIVWRTAHELHTAERIILLMIAILPASTTTALVNFMGEHSIFLSVIVFLICFGVIAFMALALLGSSKRRPNLTVWRHVQELRLRQAACLFADVVPNDPEVDRPGDANAWYVLLEQDWEDKKLERVLRDSPNVRVTTRQSLKKFAARYEYTPPFLKE
jgi:hypothetical protein